MLPENIEWGVTCEFTSLELAQKFYKLIMRSRQSELVNAYTQSYIEPMQFLYRIVTN